MFKNWGLKRLNDVVYHESIDEMKHADKYIERILSRKVFQTCRISASWVSVKMSRRCYVPTSGWSEGAKDLREAIAYADSVFDYVSRDMMIEILADEEGHIDWLETGIGFDR